MAIGSTAAALRQVRALVGAGAVAGLSDGELLDRFAQERGESAELAFSALVARHGPMVLGVCRRALPDPSDAEDAFQATFLVLVRKGGSVRVDDSLGRWLHGVSRKVAARARAGHLRRLRVEGGANRDLASVQGPTTPDRPEVLAALDEEVARLAEPFRSAVVLCDLGGLTHEEAARDLGCPVGTIKSRLSRGRDRLRRRLIGRGFAPRDIRATVPAALIDATSKAAARFAAVQATAGAVPASAAILLAEGVLKAMTISQWKTAAAAALMIGLAASGAGLSAQDRGGSTAEQPKIEATSKRQAPAEADSIGAKLETPVTIMAEEDQLRGVLVGLGKQANVEIIVDAKSLASAGTNDRALVTLHVRDLKLGTALKYLLKPIKLDYRAEGNQLVIYHPYNNFGEDFGRGMEKLRDHLDEARAHEATVGRYLKPSDPELVKARAQVARIESAIRRIDAVLQGESEPPAEAEPATPGYVVEPPDIIRVEVSKALPGRPITGERLVKPDGTISIGFYGNVAVTGLTPTAIKARVIGHLRQFLTDEALGLTRIDPGSGRVVAVEAEKSEAVVVEVTSSNSKCYYVQGDVAQPGRQGLTGNETALDAILRSGGPPADLARRDVLLIRPAPPGQPGARVLKVDTAAIVDRGDTSTNYPLRPGDRLIVGRGPEPAPKAGDLEARMAEVERKLDAILKRLDMPAKP